MHFEGKRRRIDGVLHGDMASWETFCNREGASFERFDSQKTVLLRHVAIERNMPKVFCKREN